ncbi:MAG: hypothetical protein JRD68_00225 [Deltaproteobacteria bacterium]|nr:hypothetical protein [Deltaproteobacteria bacterium]
MLEVKLEADDNGYRSVTTMRIYHNGTLVISESDGGEPEDNSFGRDWNWVPGAIQQAYDLGLKDGLES